MKRAICLLALIGSLAHAAAITWEDVRNVTGDADVATNGVVVKAYTFATGHRPTVNGVAFQRFADQALAVQSLGKEYAPFYGNPSLSDAYNQLLSGGAQDTDHLDAPAPRRLTLKGLTPGRQYQVQLWVADNRSWPDLAPAFASAAQTVQGSPADVNVPTLRWQGGAAGPTAQYVIGAFTADKPRQTLTFTPTAGFFKGRNWFSSQLNALVLLDQSPGVPPPPAPPAGVVSSAPVVVKSLDDCNVVWTTPSTDSFGSMPLGNGDVGANVWVDDEGDLLFYISKVDAFDAGHLLPKLGRVRLRFEPALSVDDFEQTLVLRDGAIAIRAGEVDLRVWVDAHQPVVRVNGSSRVDVAVAASFETLRPCAEQEDRADRLAWGYRNETSSWIERVRAQNTPEFAARVQDPILHRTSGCRLSGPGFVRDGKRSLRSSATRSVDLAVHVLSSQTDTLPEWFAELEQPVRSDWDAHRAWWGAFWNRSHLFVTTCGDGPVDLDPCRFTQFAQGSKAYAGHRTIGGAENAAQLSQRYALERFCQAAASRGTVPPPYNGSIFTMDMPAGVLGFNAPKPHPVSPDGRDWAQLSFMWQNTRHPYWSMPARGDYDTIEPGMRFVRDGLELGRDRCRKIFGFDAAFIMEASWWHNVGVFDWERMPGHLRFHQLATIELPAIMAETYEHTRDRKFLDEVLLPCADAGLDYYAKRFTKRDSQGRMLMDGVGCAETFQGVSNPCTEIGCLKFLLTKLLTFEIDDARRAKWSRLLAELPGVPTRRIRGLDLLAVGDVYDPGREICESPEMYSVYPFRQAWLGTPDRLAMARQSFHVRTISLDGTDDKQAVETGGWQSAPVQAAHLGLAREAARLASINFNDRFIHWTDNVDPDGPFPQRPRARFPAFWECKMDGTPDNDHGANSVNTLQSMLLQCDGRTIYLLPAWPEDWDVDFKLSAPDRTTVECVYRDGRVQSLKVTPEARRADVVDLSTPERRIQTLVQVACADRNFLFGLPPMLDALPKAGPATGAWLAKYGESVTDVRAAPWPGCVFRGNTVYVHGAAPMPPVPAKLVASNRLSAAILKLDYDQPIEPFAQAAPSRGSLSAGKSGPTLDLGEARTFDRVEFTIENPGYRRGQGKRFELQVQEADGAWRTVHAGSVFGTIYAKPFAPVTARHVRLVTEATLRQVDLFNDAKGSP